MKYLTGLLLSCLSIASIASLTGCATRPSASAELEGIYALSALGENTFPDATPAQMRIAGSSVSGRGPVNQWSGQLIDGKIEGIIATRMAGPPQLMRLEQQLLSALDGATLRKDGATGIRFVKNRQTVASFQLIRAGR